MEFISTIDIDQIDYEKHLGKPQFDGDYGRTILTLEPFECVLIHWPAGVESAIHLHDGLFGYVWILEGELDNIFYQHKDGKLIEKESTRYGRTGLIPEPDGVIHKLANKTKKRSVSLHFYYPAIESFKGMKLYNVQTGAVGELSDQAQSASWNSEPGHFEVVHEKAFEFISFDALNQHKSHLMVNMIPKPSEDRIREMNESYFSEQAHQYDFSDFNQPSRKRYVSRIDAFIAQHLKEEKSIDDVLDIAIGTGRRSVAIREMAGLDYTIHGVDISDEMCALAARRGIDVHNQDWVNCPELDLEQVDVITFLYAFGHLESSAKREKAIQKVHRYLKPGGLFFVDLFSINNVNEWGPRVAERFDSNDLGRFGYERGDVFYRKRGLNEIAFVHYFEKDEVINLMKRNGFVIETFHHVGYAKNPGEIVQDENQGNMFVVARKV